jgi:hypothetical protein
MTQVRAIYELYKYLPEKDKHKLKKLIRDEAIDVVPVIDQIRDGLREIKAIRQGKATAIDLDDFLNEMRNERKTNTPTTL